MTVLWEGGTGLLVLQQDRLRTDYTQGLWAERVRGGLREALPWPQGPRSGLTPAPTRETRTRRGDPLLPTVPWLQLCLRRPHPEPAGTERCALRRPVPGAVPGQGAPALPSKNETLPCNRPATPTLDQRDVGEPLRRAQGISLPSQDKGLKCPGLQMTGEKSGLAGRRPAHLRLPKLVVLMLVIGDGRGDHLARDSRGTAELGAPRCPFPAPAAHTTLPRVPPAQDEGGCPRLTEDSQTTTGGVGRKKKYVS